MIDPSTLNWQKDESGLLPAVIQDARNGNVLMLGYMNREALEKTLASGFVTFFSRSKKRLWKKGEESGNTLRVISIRSDCDNDAILIEADTSGPTCHTGAASCFNGEESALETLLSLIETIRDRSQPDAPKGSYTRDLLEGGIDACGAKLLEEAEEVVRAARSEGKQRTIEESADLFFHLLVLLRLQGIELEDVAAELKKRRK